MTTVATEFLDFVYLPMTVLACAGLFVLKVIVDNDQRRLDEFVPPDELSRLPPDVKSVLSENVPVRRRDVIEAQAACERDRFVAKQKSALSGAGTP